MVRLVRISYVATLFLILCGGVFGQTYFSVWDWDCEARVDSTRGGFGVGKHSTGEQLTFEFPTEALLANPSSNPVFKIDGEIYAWVGIVPSPDHDLYDYMAPDYPKKLLSTNTIQNRWIFPLPGSEEVQIDQFFTPDHYTISVVDDAETTLVSLGVIKVKYHIVNSGMLPHSIGVEHKWDININGRDDAPVSIPGNSADTNSVYEGSIPGAFVAAEFDLFDSDLDQLVATGLIGIEGATPPDFFAYGNEFMLIPSKFDIDITFAGGDYANSGVLLRWNPRTFPAGYTLDLITKYGFGNISSVIGDLSLAPYGSNWPAEGCSLGGNPKVFWADIQNNSSGLTPFDTVWVCVDYDSGLATMVIDPLDIYVDSLCVEYLDMAPGDLYSPRWLFNSVADTFGTFCITYSGSTSTPGIANAETTSCFDIPYISGIGPDVEFIQPSYSFTACTTGSGLELWVLFDETEDTVGLNFAETVVRIDVKNSVLDTFAIVDWTFDAAFQWGHSDGNLLDTLMIPLDTISYLSYGTGDSIIICVLHAVDFNDCSALYICDTILVDQDPPEIWFINPPPDTSIASPAPMIQIGLSDYISGVDSTKIFYTINGVHYDASFPGSYYNPTTKLLMHTPPFDFPCEAWVDVCLDSAADLTDGFCGPNWVYDSCWSFFVDCNPPTIEMIQPSNLSIISCDTAITVIFAVHDSTCVDTTAGIVNFIPGPTCTLSTSSCDVEWMCDTIFIHGVDLPSGAIRVDVKEIQDGVGNVMAPVVFNFMVDTLGPMPDSFSISPIPGSWVSPSFACSVKVSDDSPIDELSLNWRFIVDATTFEYDIAAINTSIHSLGVDNTLIYSNALSGFPLDNGDTVHCCVTRCNDVAELCGQNTLAGDSICWDYFVDGIGPEASLLWPEDGSISACVPLGWVDVLISDISEVDPTTVLIQIAGLMFPVTQFGDTFRCYIGPADPIPLCPDSVTVKLVQANDLLGNITLDSSWSFMLDTIPPFSDPLTWSPTPTLPIPPVSPFDTITFVVEPGCAGWFSHSNTLLELFTRPSGDIDTIKGSDSRVIWDADTWNLPIPSLDWIVDSDTICIRISHLEDSLDYMGLGGCSPAFAEGMMGFDEWCIRVSAGGPMISRRQPLKMYLSCFDPPNGFTYRVYDDDGLNANTIRFVIHSPGAPDSVIDWGDLPGVIDTSWILEPDEFLVTLNIDLSTFAAVGETVCVEFNRIQDMFGILNEGVDNWCVVVDTTNPCPDDFYPTDSLEIFTRTPLIWSYVPRDFAPVLGDSLAFSLDGGSSWIWVSDTSGAVYWVADTAFFNVGLLDASLWVSGGDTVDICIRNTDDTDTLVGCDLNHCQTCWTFWLASNGPIPHAAMPEDGWISACPTVDSMVIALSDSDGIYWPSIEVTCSSYVFGTSNHYVWPSGNLHNRPETLIVIPDVPYSSEDTIGVTVWAYDNLMNFVSSGPYEYEFIIDQTPPESIWTTPSCVDDSISDNTPVIWFNAHDIWGRVDTLAWCIGFLHPGTTTEWDTICYDDAVSAWMFTGSTDSVGLNTALVPQLDPWWFGGDTIIFTVLDVCDWADICEPNCIAWSDTCRLPVAARGPDIINLWPSGNGVIGCEQPDTLEFEIFDIDGIDISSLTLWYRSCVMDSVDYGITDSGMIVDYRDGPDADTLYFVPPEILAEGCRFQIGIEVIDMIGNAQEPNSFDFVYDYTPPEFIIDHPFDEAFSFTPEVYIVFPDNIAGIDTNSVTVSVVGGPCAFVSATSPAPDTIEWRMVAGIPETLIFSFDPLDCILTTGDSACIHVDMACDYAAACPACTTFDTTWCFEVVQGGPEAEITYPLGLVCPEDTIVLDFDDMDGVVVTGMSFTVNGVPVAYPGPELSWDPVEYVLVFSPATIFDIGDVEICISGVEDGLGYAMTASCWDLTVDVEPPVVEYLSPTGTVIDHHPEVRLAIWDSLNFVRPDCFVLTINSDTFTYDDSILTWIPESTIAMPGTLVWSAVLAGDTLEPGPVEICLIEACDSTGCLANNMLSALLDTFCWSFDVDTGDGPIVTLEQPDECGLGISCTTAFQFRWSIRDVEGVNPSSIIIGYGERGLVHSYNIDSPEVTLIDHDSTLLFEPGAPEAPGSIWVTIDNMNDVLGNPAFGFEDTCWFVIDWDAPYILDYWPDDLSEVATPYPLIRFHVTDTSYILDYSTAIIYIDGTAYPVSDPHVYWHGDTVFFDPSVSPSLPFGGGDTVIFCLDSLADSTVICDPNVMATECYTFYINADGPRLSIIFPDTTIDPMVTFCDSGAFWIHTIDPERIDTSEVIVLWDGDTVKWSDSPELFELRPDGADEDTVVLWPPSSYDDGDTVCLEIIQWPDSLGNNYFGSLNLCAVVDLSPPETDFISPMSGEISIDWSPDIMAHLIDGISWINHDNVSVRIDEDGTPWGSYPWPATELSWSDDTIIFSTDADFTEFSEICVYLIISDSTTIGEPFNCPPNDTTIDWCFTIGDDDTTGPEIVIPDSCYVRADYDGFFITLALSDADGVFDDASTDTTGQGLMVEFFTATNTYWIPMDIDSVVEYSGPDFDSLYWASTAPGAIPEADLVSGMFFGYIVWSHDNDFDFDNPDDRQAAISDTHWCVVYNDIPPVIVVSIAPDSSYVSCLCPEQSIEIEFQDEDTLISDMLVLEVNGTPYSTASSQVTWNPGFSGHHFGSHYLYYIPDTADCWSHGETVEACVRGVIDRWGNEATDYCWEFYMDFFPPVAWCIAEIDTNVDVAEFDSVVFHLDDVDAGVDPDEIILQVNQIVGGATQVHLYDIVSEPALRYDAGSGTLILDLRYAAGLSIGRDDSLFFSIAHTQDMAGICEENSLDDYYMCVKYIKPVTRCHASPQPFTPPPPADGYNDEVIFDYPGRIDIDGVVKIYDMQGRQMAEIFGRDAHKFVWDGYDFNGVPVRPGVYIYVIEQGGEVLCSGTVVLAR